MQHLPGLLILLAFALVLLVFGLSFVMAWQSRRPPRHTLAYALARGIPADPGEMSMPFEAWALDRPDGAAIPVWEIATSGGETVPNEADAVTLIMVHGWGQSKVDMLSRLDPWRHLCDRLVLYDLRGHGDAENGLTRLGHDEHEDLVELIGRLEPGRVILAGWSMGGVIAVAAAASESPHAARVSGVVAYGPYLDFHTSMRGRLRSVALPTRPLTDMAMTWFRLSGLRHGTTLDHAARLRCPLLVVHGTDDPICPFDHGRQLADHAADGELFAVEGAAHLDVIEVDPEGHDRAVRGFVARLPRLSPVGSPRSALTTDV